MWPRALEAALRSEERLRARAQPVRLGRDPSGRAPLLRCRCRRVVLPSGSSSIPPLQALQSAGRCSGGLLWDDDLRAGGDAILVEDLWIGAHQIIDADAVLF